MKSLVKLIVAALLIHATWRAGSVYWRYFQFKDDLQQTAQFSGESSVPELHNRVIELAEEYDIPLEPGQIEVQRVENHTIIDASYEEQIEVLPRYYYPWKFDVSVDAFTIVPKRD